MKWTWWLGVGQERNSCHLACLLLLAWAIGWTTGASSLARAEDIRFGNSLISVTFDTDSALFTVTDLRNGLVYEQDGSFGVPVLTESQAGADGASMTASLWDGYTQLQLQLHAVTPPGVPEVRCEIASTGPLEASWLPYPAPFASQAGDFLVVPLGEGIMYPADDTSVEEQDFALHCGWKMSMPWCGLCRGENGPGAMTIIETPDDACLMMNRASSGRLEVRPVWFASRGDFSYTRTLRYVFTTAGGYVSQAKRYRQHAQETGLFKSLAEKRAENPNVDLLIGAANVWTLGGDWDTVATTKELQSLGMERILYSAGYWPATIPTLNAMPGVLTGIYDIYQDVWPPDQPSWAAHEGWPEDLVWGPDLQPVQGWVIIDGDNSYPGGVVCTKQQIAHAQARIPADLAATPYRARFIDTTCASPWRECYNPDHPVSRSEDRSWRMELLRYTSEDMGMVTGTESGIDPSVPYTDYYEGMLSLGPYRVPNAGYNMWDYAPPTPELLKYQVGPYYRVPLWELVYHDCTVAMWYWGDSSNKIPEVWDQRDLINVLYGTPPLFMMTPEILSTYKTRFVQSYRATCPAARTLGYEQMVSHEFLTQDHTLQRSTWANGTTITVNFADTAQALPEGGTIGPKAYVVRATVFFDTPSDFWAYAHITACAAAGIVKGYSDGLYHPEYPVTRDQMAVYIARSLVGPSGDAAIPDPTPPPSFSDVPSTHWAYEHIEYAVSQNVVKGYDDGTYKPDLVVDRGQMAAFVARAMVTPSGDVGIPDPVPPATFSDVPSDFWAYKQVEYCVGQGVVKGYDDGLYHPEWVVTRDQMAVYICRAFQLPM